MSEPKDKGSEAIETMEDLGFVWDGAAWQGRDTQYPPTSGRRLTIVDAGDLMVECLWERSDRPPPPKHIDIIEMWARMTEQFASAPKPEEAESACRKARVMSAHELIDNAASALRDEISSQAQALAGSRKNSAIETEFLRLCGLLQGYRDARAELDIAQHANGNAADKPAAIKLAARAWLGAADALHDEILRQSEAMRTAPDATVLQGPRHRLFDLARTYEDFRPAL